jgi:hypothetical protein
MGHTTGHKVLNYAQLKGGRKATGAEKRCIEMVLEGISDDVRIAIEAELSGHIDTLAACSAQVMMAAHTALKDIEEATGIPILQGEVILNGFLKETLEKDLVSVTNIEIEDEEEQDYLDRVVVTLEDSLHLLGMRHMEPYVYLSEQDELKVEIHLRKVA